MNQETPPEVKQQLEGLAAMTTAELSLQYEAVFGERPRSKNRRYLEKRVAWGLQSAAYGETLSDAARQRAREIARLSDLRLTAPATKPAGTVRSPVNGQDTPALPPPGSLLTRRYRGKEIRVLVLADGFEYEGATYRSLSAIAKQISGSHCSGPRWFGLVERKKQ